MCAWGRQKPEQADWYWQASPEDRKEYDAFGPWIEKIRSAKDMPPRFRGVYGNHIDANCLLKVPIQAERVDVRPGMDLYRMVIAVHDERISFLEPADGFVMTRSVPWDEIVALRTTINLMVASFSILLKGGQSIDVDFSAVSIDQVNKVIDYIRDRMTHVVEHPVVEIAGVSVTITDHFYKSMLAQLRTRMRRPLMPLHFEPRDRLCRGDSHHYGLSTGVLAIDARDELIIIDRGEAVRRFLHPSYITRLTFVPYARLRSFSLVSPEQNGRHAYCLVLNGDRQSVEQTFLMAPDEVAACLDAHGIAAFDP